MLLLILLLILLLLLRLRSKYKLLLATTHQSKHSSNYSKIHLALPRRCIYLMVVLLSSGCAMISWRRSYYRSVVVVVLPRWSSSPSSSPSSSSTPTHLLQLGCDEHSAPPAGALQQTYHPHYHHDHHDHHYQVPQQPSHSDEFTLALTRQLLLLSESLATERARNNMLERRIRQLRPESKRNLGGLLDDGHQEMDYSRSDIIKQQKFEYDSRIGPPKTMAAAVENKIRKEENDLEKERQQLILRNRETLKRILGSEALEMMSPSEQLHQQMGWDTNPSEQRRRQQVLSSYPIPNAAPAATFA